MAAVTDLVSDFSGKPGATPITVNVGGVTFVADIHPDDIHKDGLSLRQFLTLADRKEPVSVKRDRSARIRLWGRANGYPYISEAGRLPTDLVNAYYAQYPEEKPQ